MTISIQVSRDRMEIITKKTRLNHKTFAWITQLIPDHNSADIPFLNLHI
jgi:hypothetical protein